MSNNGKDQDRRVVITGLGVVSSLGIGWQDFWKNLIAGKSGISRISSFDTSKYDRHYAGEIKDFHPEEFINKKRVSHLGRASQMAIAAGKLALDDAGFSISKRKVNDIAVCMGTTTGEIQLLERFNDFRFNGVNHYKTDMFSVFPANSLSSSLSREFHLVNKNYMFTAACASGNYAIGYACDLIRNGKTKFALAGGADAFSRIVFTGFGRIFSIAPEMCQPFDKNRKGMIPGEGAGIVFMETLESARERDVEIYAEVLGSGLACDAHHMTNPTVDGISKAMVKAIKSSMVLIDDIDYISAHGTGTRGNDKAESLALNKVFGRRLKDIPVSSIKSMLGHTMGAASAIETITCCLTIKNGVIPPTINFKERDPECNVYCVPNESIKREVKVVLNNSQAFGGNNACLVLSCN